MNRFTEKLESIFADENLDLLIGYEKGTLPLSAIPAFVESAENAGRLIFDLTCQNNLAKYLVDEKKSGRDRRVGIVAKGCDARSAVELVVEGQFERDRLIIIGVPCRGVIDPNKLRNVLKGKEITGYKIDGDRITLVGPSLESTIETEKLLSDSCLSCRYPNAPQYDYFIGEPAEPLGVETDRSTIEELEKMTIDERWEYFEGEYGKCIRCYACRNVCPMCFCDECFVDCSNPQWIGKGNDITDTMIFHIVRAMHTAGRCTACGACSRACPMGIDIASLEIRIGKEVEERFGFIAGLDFEKRPAMAAFDENDKEEFII